MRVFLSVDLKVTGRVKKTIQNERGSEELNDYITITCHGERTVFVRHEDHMGSDKRYIYKKFDNLFTTAKVTGGGTEVRDYTHAYKDYK